MVKLFFYASAQCSVAGGILFSSCSSVLADHYSQLHAHVCLVGHSTSYLVKWHKGLVLLQTFASEDRLNAHVDSHHYVQHLLAVLPSGNVMSLVISSFSLSVTLE